ncbi:mitochondrial carrier [Auriscalpium vulgare]|uniref:Mitochondrial carrier n=1 Tax=Auriscalpium vulgare TaxID=40419 RepID=A0ACB8RA74_9AGAM|nr:mitochondrial carrier [Auriscalpium vulgare]
MSSSSDSLIHAVAGAAGGIVAMTATYPLIFLSTRAAVETKKEDKTTYQAILDIIKREGVLGLYSGLNSSLLGIAVTNGVYYYFYERSKGVILQSRPGKGLSTLESILAGLIAGSATTIASNPIWVVQTSQATHGLGPQLPSTPSTLPAPASSPSPATAPLTSTSTSTEPTRKLSIAETAAHILRTGGPAAFFRGLGPALVLVVNPVLQYTVFEQLKNTLVRRRAARGERSPLTDWHFFVLGALSKLVATGSTYPYIVIKSRLQAGHQRYRSALHGLQTIIKEEGVEGLYKGVGSKLLQSVLTAAILFAGQRRIYEMTKKAIAAAAVAK